MLGEWSQGVHEGTTGRNLFRLAGSMFRGQGVVGATHKDELGLALEVSGSM